MILSGSKDSTLKVWDIRNRKLKTDLPGHADEVYAVDWSTGKLRDARSLWLGSALLRMFLANFHWIHH